MGERRQEAAVNGFGEVARRYVGKGSISQAKGLGLDLVSQDYSVIRCQWVLQNEAWKTLQDLSEPLILEYTLEFPKVAGGIQKICCISNILIILFFLFPFKRASSWDGHSREYTLGNAWKTGQICGVFFE